jgi:hypothetical protein
LVAIFVSPRLGFGVRSNDHVLPHSSDCHQTDRDDYWNQFQSFRKPRENPEDYGGLVAEESSGNQRIDPQSISVANAAQLLSGMGFGRVAEAMIANDLEAGAPWNADGTVNLVHYAAWLIKEDSRGD